MKKLLFGLIALVSLVCFSSCSNEEGNNAKSNPIVGTWECTKSWTDGSTQYYRLTFKSNGRFTAKTSVTYEGEEKGSWTYTGEYECEDGSLYFYFDDDDYAGYDDLDYVEHEYEISNNKLYIYHDDVTLVYKRK